MPVANSSNISTIQILRSYSNTTPTTLDDGQLAYSFVSNTLFIGSNTGVKTIGDASTAIKAQAAYDQANGAFVKANAAFDQANVTIGVDTTQNTRLTVIEGTNASQNVRLDYSNAAITIIQGVDASQNARMTIGDGVNTSQNLRIDYSNTAITIIQGVDVSQNARMTIIEGTDVSQNARMAIADGVDASQNVRLDYSNTAITVIQGTDVGQNSRMTIIEGTNASQNVRIDYSNTAITIIQGTDVSQNARMTIIEGVDSTQNTSMAATDGKMNSGYAVANNASSNTIIIQGVDASQNARMAIADGVDASQNVRIDYSNTAITIIQGVDVGQNTRLTVIEGTDASQNARLDYSNTALTIAQGVDNSQNVRLDYSNAAITIIQGTDTSQNARMTIIEGVDVTQNTNIANKLSLTGALNQTVSGNVTISQDLIVSGNLVLTGNITSQNVQQLAVADPLIILGLGNYVSDTKDIGFAAHYNDGTNAHAGLIRDSGTKEFYVFQGYTPELDSNNNVIITDPTFRTANLNASYVKSNLIATTAVVNGIDLSTYTQATYAQANVTIGVDATQNTRLTVIEGTDVSQNVRIDYSNTAITIIQGTDASQNARMTIIEGVDVTQNTSMAATDGKMQSAYNQANTGTVLAQAAFNQANNQILSGWTANTVLYANNTGYMANSNMRWDNVQNQLMLGFTGAVGNLAIGTTSSVAPITLQKTYSTPTGGEQFGTWLQTTYSAADTNLKQGLRLNTYSSNTSGTLVNVVGILNLMTASGVGGTTTSLYGNWSRNDVVLGAYVTNAFNYYVADSGSTGYANNQYGFYTTNLGKSTNNYGFYGTVNTGANIAYNLYMAGTAPNYLAGSLTIANNVPSTSTTTGGLIVSGGLGVAGNTWTQTINAVGGVNGLYGDTNFAGQINGNLYFASKTYYTTNNGNLIYLNHPGAGWGTISVPAANTFGLSSSNQTIPSLLWGFQGTNTANGFVVIPASSNLAIQNTSTSTSNTTGALTVAGGIGTAGPIYSTGGSLTINNGLATTGNSGTIFLGDGQFTKTYGGSWTFAGGVTSTGSGFIAPNYPGLTYEGYTFSGTGQSIYQPSIGVVGITANSVNAFSVSAPASSVNYLNVSANTTGNAVSVFSVGSDANVNLNLVTQGFGTFSFLNSNSTNGITISKNIPINEWQIIANNTSNLGLVSTGGGSINFWTSTTGSKQFVISPTVSAVNYIQTTGSTTGASVVLSSQGSDGNIGFVLRTKGVGAFTPQTEGTYFQNLSTQNQMAITNTASAVNYIQATGNTTGGGPVLSAQGSDTNIDLNLAPKANGNVQVIGTSTSSRIYLRNYDNNYTTLIENNYDPQQGFNIYNSGNLVLRHGSASGLILNYVNANTSIQYRGTSQLSINGSNNQVSILGSTVGLGGFYAGAATTGVTRTVVAQDTIQHYFVAEANPRYQIGRDIATNGGAGIAFGGNGGYSLLGVTETSGANLYFKVGSTSIGTITTNPTMTLTTASLNVYSTTASTSNTSGALIVNGGLGVAGSTYLSGNVTVANTSTGLNTLQISQGYYTQETYIGITNSSTYGSIRYNINPGSGGAGHFFTTYGSPTSQGVIQFAVIATAGGSAVNYLQASGNTTGNAPTLTAVGNDNSVALTLQTKNANTTVIIQDDATAAPLSSPLWITGSKVGLGRVGIKTINALMLSTGGTNNMFFNSGGGTATNGDGITQFVLSHTASAVNYLQVTGNTTGGGAVLSAQGTDTNIGININPKGAGSANITSTANSTSNTSGALIVNGGMGITGNIFLSAANNYYSTTGASYQLGWTDNYFSRNSIYNGLDFTGNYLNINPKLITTGALSIRNIVNNDAGNNTIIFAGQSGLLIQNGASSISNTTGALIVNGGLGLSGNLSMNLSSTYGSTAAGRLTLTQAAYIQAADSNGNLAIGGGGYIYFNTGVVFNQSYLTQRGPIANDQGNNTVLFAGSSPVKIQNGTASTNTTTGALVVQGGVGISGALNATTKSFNIPHPTKEGKDLRYGSLEGPEFGVYVRGTLKGSDTIELPDYWTKLVDANTITVSLTSIGKYQKLSVKEVKDNTIIINSDSWFKKEINCYYVVYGERADVDKLDVEA